MLGLLGFIIITLFLFSLAKKFEYEISQILENNNLDHKFFSIHFISFKIKFLPGL
jgi:hypothetical protein